MSLRTREVEALGLRTRVLEAGDPRGGEAVVMLHGSPGSADQWEDLLPRVGAFAHALALDLPGFGAAGAPRDWDHSAGSYANWLAGVLEELGIRRVHLVMSDIGGCGLVWGATHPRAFASAVLVATGALIGYRWHLVGRAHRVPVLGDAAARLSPLGFRATMRLYEPRLPRPVLDRWRAGYGPGSRRAMLRIYRTSPPVSFERLAPVLRRLDRPALVVWGARDRFVPAEQAERQRESFPRAEVVVLEDCGHYVQVEQPERLAELAIPFLHRAVGA